MKNNEILNKLFDKYKLSIEEREYLKKIIFPISQHQEFQRRMTNEFLHHSDITLGEHILEDTIITYQLSNKYQKKHPNYQKDLSIKIAMLHDLYSIPWQNNNDGHVDKFFHKHGFRHPIEAVINALNWYPELFQDPKESETIIDGIIHHMFPLPVSSIKDDFNQLELRNLELLNNIAPEIKNQIIKSLTRNKIGPISFTRSKYKEGRIMSKADKKVSFHQIKNISSAKALITGHNKSLKK